MVKIDILFYLCLYFVKIISTCNSTLKTAALDKALLKLNLFIYYLFNNSIIIPDSVAFTYTTIMNL